MIVSFHLKRFSKEFENFALSHSDRYSGAGSNLIYCLVSLHYSYFTGGEKVLDPLELRGQLAGNALFPMMEMGDAVEALNYILQELHATMVTASLGDATNLPCSPVCPAHRCFRLEMMEQTRCNCGDTSEPKAWNFCSFFFPIYVDQIVSSAKGKFPQMEQRIGKLKACYSSKVVSTDCLSSTRRCELSYKSYELLGAPEVLMLSLLSEWDSYTLQCRKVMDILCLFPSMMSIDTIFPQAAKQNYRLKSIIAFGLSHYVAYIRRSQEEVWYKYEDEKISRMGAGSYFDCVRDMLDSNFNPSALFFEKPDAADHAQNLYSSVEDWRKIETLVYQIEWRNDFSSNPEFTDGWKCKACTLNNKKGRTHCEACDTLKEPASAGLPAIHSPKPNGSEYPRLNSQSPATGKGEVSSSVQQAMFSPLVEKTQRTIVQPLPKKNPVIDSKSVATTTLFSLSRFPIVRSCEKCNYFIPVGKNCECSSLALQTAGRKLVCPSCSLINLETATKCDNCSVLLTKAVTDPCCRCRLSFEEKGFCCACGVSVRTNPCFYCGERNVVCRLCEEKR